MSRKENKLLSSAAAAAFLLSTNAADAAVGADVQIDEHGLVKIDDFESQAVFGEVLTPETIGNAIEEIERVWIASNGKCKNNGDCCCEEVISS